MSQTLAAPRAELSPYAPRILSLKINPEKIGALIGPGGKNIKRICDESGCEINIEDDGTVQIYSRSAEGMEIARREVEALSAEIEVGKIYRGKVVTIKDFGAFVEVLPGKDGLVHVSELAGFRVKRVEDIVKIGDEIWVKCLGVDEKGRVRLSRRAAMEERDRAERAGKEPTATTTSPGEETAAQTETGDEPAGAPAEASSGETARAEGESRSSGQRSRGGERRGHGHRRGGGRGRRG
jgi:polyribonucleotide nucleotidyltransferase